MPTQWLNDQSLEHTSRNGVNFKADRCDLRGGVTVRPMWNITKLQFAADFAEFAAWHALCIHKQLNGFSGYDCVDYRIVNEHLIGE